MELNELFGDQADEILRQGRRNGLRSARVSGRNADGTVDLLIEIDDDYFDPDFFSRDLAQLLGCQVRVTQPYNGFSPLGLRIQMNRPNAGMNRVRHITLNDSVQPRYGSTSAGHSRPVWGCAVNHDGSIVVTASEDASLNVWDAKAGSKKASLTGHTDRVNRCSITPDGKRVVSASSDGTLRAWDADSGASLMILSGHGGPVNDCAVSSDGQRIVSASEDNTVRVWDGSTGKELGVLQGHSGSVLSCDISGDGSRVVSTSFDRTVKLWDLSPRLGTTASLVDRMLHRHDYSLRFQQTHRMMVGLVTCAISDDGSTVLSNWPGQTIKVWDGVTGEEKASLVGHADSIRTCAISRDGSRAASLSDDGVVKVWDVSGAREICELGSVTYGGNVCAISGDGLTVAAYIRGTMHVWDLH